MVEYKGRWGSRGLGEFTEMEDSTVVLSVVWPFGSSLIFPRGRVRHTGYWPLPDLPISNSAGEDQQPVF